LICEPQGWLWLICALQKLARPECQYNTFLRYFGSFDAFYFFKSLGLACVQRLERLVNSASEADILSTGLRALKFIGTLGEPIYFF